MKKIGCVQHDCDACVKTKNALQESEAEITRLRGIVSTLWDALETYGPEYMHGNNKKFYRKQFESAVRASS